MQKLLQLCYACHLLLPQKCCCFSLFNFLAINLATSLLIALLLGQPSHLLLKCSVSSSSSSFSSPFFLSTANQNELFMPEMLAHTRLHTTTATTTTTTTTVEGTSFARWILPSPLLSPCMESTWATAQLSLGLGFFLHLWLHLLFNFDCCCCFSCCCTPFSIFKWSQFLMSWQDTQRIPKRIRIRIRMWMRMCLKVKLGAQRTTIKNARRSRE